MSDFGIVRRCVAVGGPLNGRVMMLERFLPVVAFPRPARSMRVVWPSDLSDSDIIVMAEQYVAQEVGYAFGGLTLRGIAWRWEGLTSDEFVRACLGLLIADAMTAGGYDHRERALGPAGGQPGAGAKT